jgi:hypothetical protein
MKLKDKKNETLEPHIGPVQSHEEDEIARFALNSSQTIREGI